MDSETTAKDQALSTPTGSSVPPETLVDSKAALLRIVKIAIVGTLIALALKLVTYAIEAWNGTLDLADVFRFIPKAAFGLILIGYVLRRVKTKTPF